MGKEGGPHFPYPQYPHTWVCHMESTLHLSIYFAATYSNFITFLLNFQEICDLPLGPYTPLFHRMNKSSGHIQTLLKAQNLSHTQRKYQKQNLIISKQIVYVSLKKKTDQVEEDKGVYTFWKQLLHGKSYTIEGLI